MEPSAPMPDGIINVIVVSNYISFIRHFSFLKIKIWIWQGRFRGGWQCCRCRHRRSVLQRCR
jgi:hypothetical protein